MTGFSIPKKKFRHSVDRHRIRRLIVESWRLNKQMLYPDVPESKQLHVFYVFTDKVMPEYTAVHAAMLGCISRLKTMVTAANTEVTE